MGQTRASRKPSVGGDRETWHKTTPKKSSASGTGFFCRIHKNSPSEWFMLRAVYGGSTVERPRNESGGAVLCRPRSGWRNRFRTSKGSAGMCSKRWLGGNDWAGGRAVELLFSPPFGGSLYRCCCCCVCANRQEIIVAGPCHRLTTASPGWCVPSSVG